MKSKKAVMGFAALIILIFHFYSPTNFIGVIGKAGYIGVDFFFFVSALCLGAKKEIKFREFIPNRLLLVYLPFVIMCVIAACLNGWKATRLVTAVTGIEFIMNGGGAFLWYLPALMLLYLITPALIRFREKVGFASMAIDLIIWAGIVSLCEFVFNWTKLNILFNRLPIFIIGLYWSKISFKPKTWLKYILIAAGMIGGALLIYKYGTVQRLNLPVRDFYYIVAIPFVVATTFLFEEIYSHWKFPLLSFFGSISLELYSFQMIFGFKLEMAILKATKLYFVSFLLTAMVIVAVSVAFHFPYKWAMGKLTKNKKGKQINQSKNKKEN